MDAPSQDTVDVPPQHSIDLESLNKYISANVGEISSRIEVVKKFGYGQSNPTYHLIAADGEQFVMRKRPGGKLIASAHRVDREYRIMKALGQRNFPVPRVIHLCEDPAVLGAAFYLMAFAKGRIPSNSLASLPTATRRPAMCAIIEALAALHSLSPESLGLTGSDGAKPFGHSGDYYPRQLHTMAKVSTQQVTAGKGSLVRIPHFEELLAEFQRRVPQDRVTVVHGDYKPDNIILHPELPKVIAIVDWELSTIGHPLSDLANLCLVYHTAGLGPVYPSVSGVAEVPSEEEVLRLYCRLTHTPYPIPDWDFYIAYAFFRLAVIAQGVAMRLSLGQASDTTGRGQSIGYAVETLGNLAWKKLTGRVSVGSAKV